MPRRLRRVPGGAGAAAEFGGQFYRHERGVGGGCPAYDGACADYRDGDQHCCGAGGVGGDGDGYGGGVVGGCCGAADDDVDDFDDAGGGDGPAEHVEHEHDYECQADDGSGAVALRAEVEYGWAVRQRGVVLGDELWQVLQSVWMVRRWGSVLSARGWVPAAVWGV